MIPCSLTFRLFEREKFVDNQQKSESRGTPPLTAQHMAANSITPISVWPFLHALADTGGLRHASVRPEEGEEEEEDP